MLTLCLCGLLVALTWSPTPIGRMLRRLLVEEPARLLSGIRPATLGFVLLLMVAAAATFATLGPESLYVVGPAITDGLAWFVVFDVATYVEVIGLTWLLAASVRLKALADTARSAAARVLAALGALRRPRDRAPRTRRPTARKPKPDDDWLWGAPPLAA